MNDDKLVMDTIKHLSAGLAAVATSLGLVHMFLTPAIKEMVNSQVDRKLEIYNDLFKERLTTNLGFIEQTIVKMDAGFTRRLERIEEKVERIGK